MSNEKILLITTVNWPSVPRYAAGFAAAGCTVEAFAPANAPVGRSRYLSRHHIYRSLLPLASLKRAIEAADPDLLVACDDRAVTHLLRLHARADGKIAALIARSLGAPNNYASMISRAESLTTLAALGIRVPETHAVASIEELETSLAKIGFPAVIKADGTWGGDGVVIAHDRQQARAAFRRLVKPPSRLRSLVRVLRRRDLHYLLEAISPRRNLISVQRFIPGKPAASAFAAWQGKIAGALYYDVLVADGEVGPPNVIRRVECPEIEHATRTVARHFGLSGLHGIDFIRDSDGHVHLIEVNPRSTQGGTLPFGPGRDGPAALAAHAFDRQTTSRPAIKNDIVAFFPREWRRDRGSVWLKTGHHDVPWDDPAVLCAALGARTKTPRRLRLPKLSPASSGSRTAPSC